MESPVQDGVTFGGMGRVEPDATDMAVEHVEDRDLILCLHQPDLLLAQDPRRPLRRTLVRGVVEGIAGLGDLPLPLDFGSGSGSQDRIVVVADQLRAVAPALARAREVLDRPGSCRWRLETKRHTRPVAGKVRNGVLLGGGRKGARGRGQYSERTNDNRNRARHDFDSIGRLAHYSARVSRGED